MTARGWRLVLTVAMMALCAVGEDRLDLHRTSSIRELASALSMPDIVPPIEVSSPTETSTQASNSHGSMEIEARALLFRRRPSPNRSGSRNRQSTSTTTPTPTTTTEDISILFSLYGAPARDILLSREEEIAVSHSAAVDGVKPSALRGPLNLGQLASPLHAAINEFTYDNIQDAFDGLVESLRRPGPDPRWRA